MKSSTLGVLFGLLFLSTASTETKFPSPNGKFAISLKYDAQDNDIQTASIIEVGSGKVILTIDESLLWATFNFKVLWSDDSSKVAIFGRAPRVGITKIYTLSPKIALLDWKSLGISELDNLSYIRSSFDSEEPIKWLNSESLLISKTGRVQTLSTSTMSEWVDYTYEVEVKIGINRIETSVIRRKQFDRFKEGG